MLPACEGVVCNDQPSATARRGFGARHSAERPLSVEAGSGLREGGDRTGGYRGQMAVLVKPNGLLGTVYMAVIRPFRHLIVYPLMTRETERAWRTLAC